MRVQWTVYELKEEKGEGKKHMRWYEMKGEAWGQCLMWFARLSTEGAAPVELAPLE